MPKLPRVQLAQRYMAQPEIHMGYSICKGGVGTVAAIMRLHEMLSSQAVTSTQKRTGCACQSSCIQENTCFIELSNIP